MSPRCSAWRWRGPAGRYWHAVEDGGIPFREIAEAIGSRLGLPAVSIPAHELMVPGYFGSFTNIATQNYPASSLITRQTLGWEPAQPGLLADLDNGHYFPAGTSPGSDEVATLEKFVTRLRTRRSARAVHVEAPSRGGTRSRGAAINAWPPVYARTKASRTIGGAPSPSVPVRRNQSM